MIPDFPNLPDDLQRRLDRAVPPDTRYLPPAKDDDPLVEAARRLAETPPFELSDAAVDRIEARLLAEIGAVERFDRVARRGAVPRVVRWLAYAAAACLVLVMLAGGATYVSADSLPGDPLYAVKRTVERVRLAVVAGEDEAALRVEFAERRVHEFSTLLDRGEVYPRALQEAVDELERAVASGYNGALERQIAIVAQEQETLSLQAQTRASESVRMQLQGIADQSRALLEQVTPPDASPEPPVAPPVTVTAAPSATKTSIPTPTPSATSRVAPSPTLPPTATPGSLPAAPVIPPTRTPPGQGDDPGLGDNPPGLGGEHPGVGNDGQPPGLSEDPPAPPVESVPVLPPPAEGELPPPAQGQLPPPAQEQPPPPTEPPLVEPPPPAEPPPTRTPPGHGEDPGLGDAPPGQGGAHPGVGNEGQPPGQQ